MTIGNRDNGHSRGYSNSAIISLLGFYMLLIPPAMATTWNLKQLLRGFSRVSIAKADYTETRSSNFVDGPLIEHGHLIYISPDYLAKRTTEGHSGYIVHGNVAEILGSTPPHRVFLDNYPPLAAMIAALRATLSGNAAALHHYFHIQLTGNASAWRLLLIPLKQSLAHAITSITLYGNANQLHRVEIKQTDGDHSTLVLYRQIIRERPLTAH